MTNPYQPPASSLHASAGSGRSAAGKSPAGVIQFIVGMLCAGLAGLMPALVIPQFQSVFNNFGAELPLLTRIAVGYHLWLLLLPVLVVAARIFWPAARRRALASCLVGVMIFFSVTLTLVLAMYMPIFQLGQVQ